VFVRPIAIVVQFLLGEYSRSGLELGVRHGGVGNPGDRFSPCERCAFARVEQFDEVAIASRAPLADGEQVRAARKPYSILSRLVGSTVSTVTPSKAKV
jgi:hypothetical protein